MPGHNTGNKLFKKIYLNYKYIYFVYYYLIIL